MKPCGSTCPRADDSSLLVARERGPSNCRASTTHLLSRWCWRRSARPLHEGATVHPLRGVQIVCTAEQADPIRSVKPRSREPVQMIEFERPGLGASVAVLVDERAAASVARDDLPLDGGGNVARRRRLPVLVRRLSRLPDLGEALLLDLFDERVEYPFEDRCTI